MSGTALSSLRLVAWGALALGGILLLSLALRLAQGMWRRMAPLNVWRRYAEEASPHRRRPRQWGWLGGVAALLLAFLCLGVGGALLYLEKTGAAYAPFPPDEHVAQVRCVPEEEPAERMVCSLITGSPDSAASVTLSEAEWGLEAELLVWEPLGEQLGLRSGYRLLRYGEYDEAGSFSSPVLLSAESEGMGEFLRRLGEFLPFYRVERVIFSEQASAQRFYELEVSRAGFSLLEWELEQP